MITYKSKFDSSFTVYILYPKDGERYNELQDIIPKGDIAFTSMQHKLILIDGQQIKNLTKDHIAFIELHEISHHQLKHSAVHGSKSQEMEADLASFIIAKKIGLNNVCKIIEKYFKSRHNESFKKYYDANYERLVKKLKG